MSTTPDVKHALAHDIRPAAIPGDIDAVRKLFQEYADSLPFSLCFQGFDEELRTLPGKYAHPRGEILLAWPVAGGPPVGIVAVRPIPPRDGETPLPGGICEMKRLYIKPSARGHRLGHRLAEGIVEASRRAGYAVMRLDTSADMAAAHAVYRALGFVPCDRYNNDPDPTTMFFELDLRPGRSNPQKPR